MAANKRKFTLHGVEVEQVQFNGNWYTPVNGRIKIAQTVDPATIRKQPGYKVVSYQIVQMGERWGYCCMVEYPVDSGITMPGSDFIDMKDPAGLAKAETSAVGRALGFHGIASDASIASADEMRRVVPQERAQQQQSQQEQEGEPMANKEQLASIRKLCAALGREEPDPQALTFKSAGAFIRQLSADYNQRHGKSA